MKYIKIDPLKDLKEMKWKYLIVFKIKRNIDINIINFFIILYQIAF